METQKWTNAYLEGLRRTGDGPADAAVKNVEVRGSVAEVSLFLTNLIQNDTSILEPSSRVAIPEEIIEFIAEHSALPSWVDADKVLLGQQVFMRFGPAALASLLCASLPECYSHKNGSQVLSYTQNLEEHTVRRVYQTARIILDVMRPHGLDEGGAGVQSSIKTRLLHATMRHLILTRPNPDTAKDRPAATSLGDQLLRSDWNDLEWGTPINVEDSIFTLLTFSYVILRSWDLLGCKVTDEEREAYLHCWNVVGYFLGIPVECMPTTWDEAERAFSRLQEHQQARSKEGIELTQALRQVIQTLVPDQRLAGHIDHTLMRYLIGDKTADIIGLPQPDAVDRVVTLGIHAWRLVNEGLSAVGALLTEMASHRPGATEPADATIPARIGRALTELLVALVGRGEHGFDLGEISQRATQVAAATGKATVPLKDELMPMLAADSSPASKFGAADNLGRCILKGLATAGQSPPAPAKATPEHHRASSVRRPYSLPPEFADWVSPR